MTKATRFNFKTAVLTAILLLITFCLCGCAEVNFVTYHNSDGSIHEYVYLIVDEQALINHGYNIDRAKLEIQTNSHIEAQQLINEYQAKLYQEYATQKLSNEEYTKLYNGIKIIEQNWENGEYVIGLQYTDSTTYKKYYELLNGSTFTSNSKEIKKLFYTKTYYYGTTNYGDYTIFNRIYNYYSNTVFATVSSQETTLCYSYSIASKRFHSDADKVQLDSNGNYIHTWNITPDKPARKIYFYTISANRSMWIITCVGLGLTVSAILCVIGAIKYTKHKTQNIQIHENLDNTTN